MTITIQEIRSILLPVLGKLVEKAWIGHGSFFVIEQGEKLPTKDRYEWHLWLYDTAWRLEQENHIVAACEDERERMEMGAALLEGKTLLDVKINEVSSDLTLLFEDNIILRTFSIYSEGNEPWRWFVPNGFIVAMDETHTLTHRRSDERAPFI